MRCKKLKSILLVYLCFEHALFHRLKFVPGPTGLEIFISSEMFYLEVMLEPSGGVKDVKVHHDGKVEQQVRLG